MSSYKYNKGNNELSSIGKQYNQTQ